MSWAKIDDQFFTHKKVIDLSKDAKLLYLVGLTHCSGQLTDGQITTSVLRVLAATVDVDRECVAELVSAGLWDVVEQGYSVHDYHNYNMTAEEVKERKEEVSRKRAEAGLKGAQSRWQNGKQNSNLLEKDGKNYSKPHGNDHGKPIANGMAQSYSDSYPDSDSESEGKIPPKAPQGAVKKVSRRRVPVSAPTHEPELFDREWKLYKVGTRLEAVKEWDLLELPLGDIEAMHIFLSLASEEKLWSYTIPKDFCRFLKYRVWENGIDALRQRSKQHQPSNLKASQNGHVPKANYRESSFDRNSLLGGR